MNEITVTEKRNKECPIQITYKLLVALDWNRETLWFHNQRYKKENVGLKNRRIKEDGEITSNNDMILKVSMEDIAFPAINS